MNKHKTFALLTMMVALVCAGPQAGAGGRRHEFAAGGASAKAVGDVTNIKGIRNNTRHEVRVWKTDAAFAAAAPQEQGESIPPRGVFNGDFWIPWADSADEFAYKHMTISVGGTVVARIWQSGEYVRFNDTGRFVTNAGVVSGLGNSGGDRRVVISESRGGDS